MAAKKRGTDGGLFAYGEAQRNKGKEQKLFPSMGDLNPALKETGGKKRRGGR
jgi:hypothetical protein